MKPWSDDETKRVLIHPVAPPGDAAFDERYIVELFDAHRSARPVALGFARFTPHDGACRVDLVSRGLHDAEHGQHAHAALVAFRRFVAARTAGGTSGTARDSFAGAGPDPAPLARPPTPR